MRVELGMKRYAQKEDRKRALLRRANTIASNTHTITGELKRKGGAKPVTLPRLKFTDPILSDDKES
jgi:hypothetical protein